MTVQYTLVFISENLNDFVFINFIKDTTFKINFVFIKAQTMFRSFLAIWHVTFTPVCGKVFSCCLTSLLIITYIHFWHYDRTIIWLYFWSSLVNIWLFTSLWKTSLENKATQITSLVFNWHVFNDCKKCYKLLKILILD